MRFRRDSQMDLGEHTLDGYIFPLLRTVSRAATASNQTTLVDHRAVQSHSCAGVRIH